MAKRVKDQRKEKLLKQRKAPGWNTTVKNWGQLAQENQERLWELSGKESKLDAGPLQRAKLSELFEKRIEYYKQIAQLTGTRLTRGEVSWAIQYEIIYNKHLYNSTLTEEEYRDVRVHSFKYLIELVYGRYSFPDYETLKKDIYERPIETLPKNYLEAEHMYFKELESFIEEIELKKERTLNN